MNKDSKKFHLLLVLIPIICFIIVSDIFVSDIRTIKQDTAYNIQILEEKKTESIHYIIDNRIRQARLQNAYIESAFKSYVNDYYDTTQLQKEMNSDNLDSKIINILSNIIIYDTKITSVFETHYSDHILFISNKNGIINIYNLSSNNPEIMFTNWDDYIAKKNNTQLTSSAIDKLINKKDSVLVWESSIATKNNILNTEYTNSSEETIDQIIRTNNSFEYRYYNLLVPTYVNINNQEDDTYDFIIVREINLYKTLEPLSYNINKYDTIIEDYRHEMNNLLYITILFSISITISLSISIIIGVLKTNNYIKYKFKFKKDGDK